MLVDSAEVRGHRRRERERAAHNLSFSPFQASLQLHRLPPPAFAAPDHSSPKSAGASSAISASPLLRLLHVATDVLVELHDKSVWSPKQQSMPSSPTRSPFHQSPGGIHHVEAELSSTLEVGGRILGQGTWATAYRSASGPRRQALRLLCELGIITDRELSEDLTEVPPDHVEDCIRIGSELLMHWPPAGGPPPKEEARNFFQERLKAIYMLKAPKAPFA